VVIHGQNQMKKQFSWHERRGLEKFLEERGKEIEKTIEKDRFFEHYYNLIQFDFEALGNLEGELDLIQKEEFDGDMEDAKKVKEFVDAKKGRVLSKQKAIAGFKDKLIRAEGFLQSIGIEVSRDEGYYSEELEEAKNYFIQYPKTGSKEKSEKELII